MQPVSPGELLSIHSRYFTSHLNIIHKSFQSDREHVDYLMEADRGLSSQGWLCEIVIRDGPFVFCPLTLAVCADTKRDTFPKSFMCGYDSPWQPLSADVNIVGLYTSFFSFCEITFLTRCFMQKNFISFEHLILEWTRNSRGKCIVKCTANRCPTSSIKCSTFFRCRNENSLTMPTEKS